MTTVTRPLSAGRITMSLSFLSRLRACCSSLVKLLSCSDADCIVEAILLLMLSLVDSDSFRCRDGAASTPDTMPSVGIRFGVTECFCPYDSTRVSFHSYLRDGKRCSLPSCRPVYFASVLCCVDVLSVSVDAQYEQVQSLCCLVCRQ